MPVFPPDKPPAKTGIGVSVTIRTIVLKPFISTSLGLIKKKTFTTTAAAVIKVLLVSVT